MIRSLAKLGLWFIVGAGSITALLSNINFETPWKYTVDSIIAPGTRITLTQPNGEPVTMHVAQGQTLSGRKTFDVGAPITLAAIYLVGSILTFGLKRKRPVCTGPSLI